MFSPLPEWLKKYIGGLYRNRASIDVALRNANSTSHCNTVDSKYDQIPMFGVHDSAVLTRPSHKDRACGQSLYLRALLLQSRDADGSC